MHRRTIMSAAGVAAAAILAAGCGGSDEPAAPAGPQALNPEQLIQQAGPSVVKIFGQYGGEGAASGSGVIIDAEKNLVLTNAHVVQGITALKAVTNDGTETPARVLGAAPCDDLAVVELPRAPAGLKAMPFAQGGVRPAQHVTALGYPGTAEDQSGEQGPGTTSLVFTDGRVSQAQTSAEVGDLGIALPSAILHQAPINPGNSGGPLVDDFGKLAGINSAGGGGDNQGIAITAQQAQQLVPELAAGESVNDIGWNIAPVSQELVQAQFLDTEVADEVIALLEEEGEAEGIVVLGNEPGSAAEKAELVFGDYVTTMNDTPVATPADVCDILDSATPGSTIRVEGRFLASAEDAGQDIGQGFTTDLALSGVGAGPGGSRAAAALRA